MKLTRLTMLQKMEVRTEKFVDSLGLMSELVIL